MHELVINEGLGAFLGLTPTYRRVENSSLMIQKARERDTAKDAQLHASTRTRDKLRQQPAAGCCECRDKQVTGQTTTRNGARKDGTHDSVKKWAARKGLA